MRDWTYLNIPNKEPPWMFVLPCIGCVRPSKYTGADSFPKMSSPFLIGFQTTVRQICLLSSRRAPCWHGAAEHDGRRSFYSHHKLRGTSTSAGGRTPPTGGLRYGWWRSPGLATVGSTRKLLSLFKNSHVQKLCTHIVLAQRDYITVLL